jgi:hypothetical protein
MESDLYYLDRSVLHMYDLLLWKDVVLNVILKMGFS